MHSAPTSLVLNRFLYNISSSALGVYIGTRRGAVISLFIVNSIYVAGRKSRKQTKTIIKPKPIKH